MTRRVRTQRAFYWASTCDSGYGEAARLPAKCREGEVHLMATCALPQQAEQLPNGRANDVCGPLFIASLPC